MEHQTLKDQGQDQGQDQGRIHEKLISVNNKRAIVIMCLQNDYIDITYCGDKKINNIICLINKIKKDFDQIIFIKDNYPIDHIIYKDKSVKYCVSNTPGSNLNSELKVDPGDTILHINTLNLYTSDSAFYNAKSGNTVCESNLKNILDEGKIKQVYLCGISLEQQIFTTAYDAYTFGYECFVIEDLCCGKDNRKIEKSLQFLKTLKVAIINSAILIK